MISVLSETQERFFLAIGRQLPLDRIIEIHLFQPMRQGGIESGVAVVAAVPEGEPLVEEPLAEGPLAPAPEGETCDLPEAGGPDAALDAALEASASGDDDEVEGDDEHSADDDTLDAEGQAAGDRTERSMDGVDESDEGDLSLANEDDGEPGELDDADGEARAGVGAPEAVAAAQEPRARRYTVYTAHYRHVLKGPERGKWEVSVVAEADAPLLTVDVVVRGVLRRAGDAGEPERLSGDEMRKALRQTTAPAAPAGRR